MRNSPDIPGKVRYNSGGAGQVRKTLCPAWPHQEPRGEEAGNDCSKVRDQTRLAAGGGASYRGSESSSTPGNGHWLPLDWQKLLWPTLHLGGFSPHTQPPFLGLVGLTFLPRSWLGSSGASSPISSGFMNLPTKSRSRWKARNASWGAEGQV